MPMSSCVCQTDSYPAAPKMFTQSSATSDPAKSANPPPASVWRNSVTGSIARRARRGGLDRRLGFIG